MRKDTVPPQKSITRGQRQVASAAPKTQLPSAPATKGLTYKVSKKKRPTEEVINRRLQRQSPWYTSISDPLHGADAKIPDETGVETGTCQLVERYQVSSGTNGCGGMRVYSPYINNMANTTTIGRNVQFVSSTSTTGALTFGSLAGAAGQGEPFSAVSGLQQITNAHRIVSAAMYVQPEVSLSNNSGEYCLFQNPYTIETSPLYTDFLNNYKSVAIPLSADNNAGVVRWVPLSRQDWSFKSFIRADGTTASYDDSSAASFPYWSFGFVTNCPANVSFRVTVVINYEFIPKDNVLNVLDTSVSPQDTMEVDLVERWIQEMPVAKPVSPVVASSSPSEVKPNHGENDSDTGFGMLFNIVKELAPIALSLLV